MPTFCTTQQFVDEEGTTIRQSAVVEVAGNKQFILHARWSSKVKGPKRHIEYWFRGRKIALSEQAQADYLIPFTIDPAMLRLE